jgi:hypothetical protein
MLRAPHARCDAAKGACQKRTISLPRLDKLYWQCSQPLEQERNRVSSVRSTWQPAALSAGTATKQMTPVRTRLQSIDALRGFVMGPTQGAVFGFGSLVWVWVWCFALLIPLYIPTAAYSRFKARRRDIA